MKRIWLSFIIYLFIISYVQIKLLSEGKNMDENTTAIIIAISVFILEFLVIILQHLRETKYSKEIKTDTGVMKPKIDTIENNTDIIKNDMVRNVIPKVESLTSIQNNINELVEKKHIEQKIKEQVAPQINNSDYLIESIKLIFEINATSNQKIQELLNEKYLFQNEKEHLKHRVKELKENLQELEERLRETETENIRLRALLNVKEINRSFGAGQSYKDDDIGL